MTTTRPAVRGTSGPGGRARRRQLRDADYRRLLELRTGLRRFLHWSEVQVRRAGLTPAQHQLLLAIRGAERDGEGPTIGEVADHLFRRHNTVVGLVDRAVDAGLVERHHVDRGDRRMVRLSLTEEGCSRLAALAGLHLEELERLRSLFEAIPGAAEDDEQG